MPKPTGAKRIASASSLPGSGGRKGRYWRGFVKQRHSLLCVDPSKGAAVMRFAALFAVSLLALGVQPAASQAPPVIDVQMANFKFTPHEIVLDHGQNYVLHLQ